MTRNVSILVFPDFQLLDLSGPVAAFQLAGYAFDKPPYRTRVLSRTGGPVRSSAGVTVDSEAWTVTGMDTLVVVGGAGSRPATRIAAEAAFVRHAAGHTRKLASVCTGAFILAEAGLLDGRVAATHWRHAATLQQQYPRIRVDGDRIFAKDGPVWTSAGISAGIDLSLALIEDDLGHEIARSTARELVVYHRRPGGQSQFSTLLALDPPSDRIREALAYARAHLRDTLSVEQLASVACLSPRQFARAFRAETGHTPAKAVERLRAEAARVRIESDREPIELIARDLGFADPERMRQTFLRVFGQPPQALRRFARMAA